MTTITKLHFNWVDYEIWWGNALASPTNLWLSLSGTTATLTWTDPADSTDKIYPKLSWVKSVLVKKTWSYPANPSDWTVVVTETTRNQYSSSWYVDTSSWVTTYYRIFALSNQWIYSYENYPVHPDLDFMSWPITSWQTNFDYGNYYQKYMSRDGRHLVWAFQWTLSSFYMTTAFDPSTFTTWQISWNPWVWSNDFYWLAFNPDWTKFYGALNNKTIVQYNLSTAWDISTSTLAYTLSTTAKPWNILFDRNWTKLYVWFEWNLLWVCTLSTAWDLSTAWAFETINMASKWYTPSYYYNAHFFLSDDEDKMFVNLWWNPIYQFNITNHDLSTLQFVKDLDDWINWSRWFIYPINDWNYRLYRFTTESKTPMYLYTI